MPVYEMSRFGGQTTKNSSPVHEMSGFHGHENEVEALCTGMVALMYNPSEVNRDW